MKTSVESNISFPLPLWGGLGRGVLKVCGMRSPDNIRSVEALGINWMGFIFYPKSSRYVSTKPEYLPQNCKRVGVFVNESIEGIIKRCGEFSLYLVQLHGNESADFCRQLRNELPSGIEIIKMIQIETESDLAATEQYEGVADYFLFETKCSSYGGSGQQFNWDILHLYKGNVPFLITGGISLEDAERVLEFKHPMFVGVDLNSRFEIAPALKDIDKLKQFIAIINK